MAAVNINTGPSLYSFKTAQLIISTSADDYTYFKVDNGSVQFRDKFKAATPYMINGALEDGQWLDGDEQPAEMTVSFHPTIQGLVDADPNVFEVLRSVSSGGKRTPLASARLVWVNDDASGAETVTITMTDAVLTTAPQMPMGGSGQVVTASFTLQSNDHLAVTSVPIG